MQMKCIFKTLTWMIILILYLSGCAAKEAVETTKADQLKESALLGSFTEKSYDVEIDYQIRKTKGSLLLAGNVENLLMDDMKLFELTITLYKDKDIKVAVEKVSDPRLYSNDTISFVLSFPYVKGVAHWNFRYEYMYFDDFSKQDMKEWGWFDRVVTLNGSVKQNE